MKKVNYIVDADIKGFFDNVDHGWMMKFLEHRIADKNFLSLIKIIAIKRRINMILINCRLYNPIHGNKGVINCRFISNISMD